jgi:predicted TIM-barrel fold metal-dependent hydrolase
MAGGSSDVDLESTVNMDNAFFTQGIANPFDMMNSMAFLLAGGVCERFPELKIVFLEANGGWIVPWLERLDHQAAVYSWDVPAITRDPSEYFRRQCWISFDPDESTLAFTANSPLCGADRIVWASDYPHPDAKYPGVTEELAEAIESLTPEQQRRIAGENTAALYSI